MYVASNKIEETKIKRRRKLLTVKIQNQTKHIQRSFKRREKTHISKDDNENEKKERFSFNLSLFFFFE